MISVVTGKRGVAVAVPVHPILAEILSSAPEHDAVTLAANSRGQPWTESGYNSTFGKFIGRLEQEGAFSPASRCMGSATPSVPVFARLARTSTIFGGSWVRRP